MNRTIIKMGVQVSLQHVDSFPLSILRVVQCLVFEEPLYCCVMAILIYIHINNYTRVLLSQHPHHKLGSSDFSL
jgi:hypothetical protein